MKDKVFHILSPFTVKIATTPVHDPNMVSTGNSEVIKISGVANYYGDPDTGELLIDLANEIVDPNGMDVSFFKTNPQILWQHDRNCTIGRGTSVTKKKSGIYIEAEIHAGAMEEEQFYRVKAGLISYLSIGFRTLEGKFSKVGDKNVYVITKSQLHEISLVSMPCNTESSFQIVKSLPEDQGFYGGELKDSTPEILSPLFVPTTLENSKETNIINKGADMIKGKVRDFLSVDVIKEMESKGLSEQLDSEKDVSFADLKEMILTAVKADLASEKAAADLEAKEASDLAEKEAQELAVKEAEEMSEKEAADLVIKETEDALAIKALEDILTDFKKQLVAE